MMWLKKWIGTIKDVSRGLQERMFRLVASFGLVVLFLVVVVSLILGENLPIVLALAGSWFVFLAIVIFSLKFNRVNLGCILISTVLVIGVLPMGFFTGGGLMGSAPIWFVFCFTFVCLMLLPRPRNWFLVLCTVVTSATFGIAYLHPEIVTGHTRAAGYLDSYTSILLLSALICVMIVFQTYAYQEENKLSEKQRKEIMELNQAQNRFFSSMSHEIRTPINTIIGLNEMNLREDISEVVADNSLHIQSASRILLSLINDILDMSKIESGKMTIVNASYDVSAMLSEIIGMIRVRAREKGLEFVVEVDPDTPARLRGDEVRIKQVLINLLNNAVKYTARGMITLSVQSMRDENGRCTMTYTVSDTGIGIKPESVPYLFTAFRRVDEERNRHIEGTGLGLAIVKQLVDLMGGEIHVNSIYHNGSTFVFTLPQEISDVGVVGELKVDSRFFADGDRPDYQSSFEAPNARILIVDDNEVNLMVEEKLLRDTRMTVESVMSGEECLKRTLETSYDMIFMDHLMPEMDGTQTLHALRTQAGGLNTQTPVVVLTANAGSEAVAMYERDGFDDYLMKPVTGELLEGCIRRFLPSELLLIKEEAGGEEAADYTVRPLQRTKPFVISTENVCDLPDWIIEDKQISVISYNIYTENGYFLDGVEISSDGILPYIDELNREARAEEPEVERYVPYFSKQLREAQHVIHITPSKKTSASYGHAMAAAASFDNVTVVDSGMISCGMGIMVLYAAQLVESDVALPDILKRLSELSAQIRTGFVLDSMKYLDRTGRVPKHALAVCEAFMLHPIVAVTDGVMRPQRMAHGNRRSVWEQYIKRSLADHADIDSQLLFVAYSGLAEWELRFIQDEISKQKVSFKRIIFQKVSAVSSTLFGPNTFGLIFLRTDQSHPMREIPKIRVPYRRVERRRAPAIVELETDRRPPTPYTARLSGPAADPYPPEPPEPAAPPPPPKKKNDLPEWLLEEDVPLNTDEGISHCGSEEGYLEALSIFSDTINIKADEIERYYNEEDWDNYTIKVHALKSSSRIIGADELANLAFTLEKAGKEADVELIREKTGLLLLNFRQYESVLAPMHGLDEEKKAAEEAAKPPVPEEILSDAYRSILDFSDVMDFDLVDMVLKSLEEYRLERSDAKKMSDIRNKLLVLDWDGIKAIIERAD